MSYLRRASTLLFVAAVLVAVAVLVFVRPGLASSPKRSPKAAAPHPAGHSHAKGSATTYSVTANWSNGSGGTVSDTVSVQDITSATGHSADYTRVLHIMIPSANASAISNGIAQDYRTFYNTLRQNTAATLDLPAINNNGLDWWSGMQSNLQNDRSWIYNNLGSLPTSTASGPLCMATMLTVGSDGYVVSQRGGFVYHVQ